MTLEAQDVESVVSEWPKWVYREWCGVGLYAQSQEEADAFLADEKTEDAPKRRGRPPKE